MKRISIKATDISFFAIFIAFLCATNGDLLNTKNNIIYYLPFMLCLGAYMLEILPKGKIVLSPYIIWRIAVLLIFMFSTLYAINVSSTILPIKRYILQTFVVLLISKKCLEDPRNTEKIIKIVIVAITVNLLYVYTTMDRAALLMGHRLGVSTINDTWNANRVGAIASYAIVFTIYTYLFIHNDKTTKGKVFVATLLGFFGIAMILSGSRKSILIVSITLLCYLLLASPSHAIRNIILALTAVILVIYLLYNVPFLYNNIGYRFDSLFAMLNGTGGDKSTFERQSMINVGLKAFLDKPVWGYGINCFKDINAVTGRAVYAHNNYIELMVDVGLVGLCVYYGYLFTLLATLKNRSKHVIYIKSLLIAILICDYGMVSYYDGLVQYVLCIAVCILMRTKCNESDEINYPIESR